MEMIMNKNLYEMYFKDEIEAKYKGSENVNNAAKTDLSTNKIYQQTGILSEYNLWNTFVNKVTYNDTNKIEYLFNEDNYLKAAKEHVDKTYSGHYSGQYQATSIIIDAGHGTGFNIGNIIKYAKRYSKKEGHNKEDLLKIIHYALMQLYVQDKFDLK
jgi:Protein of unknwon function (DUF3310)